MADLNVRALLEILLKELLDLEDKINEDGT